MSYQDQLIVDYSDWQGDDVPPGVVGVIVKYTEGTSTGGGSRAHQKAANAAAAGLLVLGGYDFARPGDGAAEAQILLAAVGDDPVHTYVIDAEVDGIDDGHVQAFAATIAAAGKGRALLYGSTSYVQRYTVETAGVVDLWVADYRDYQPDANRPTEPVGPWGHYVGWQFTDAWAGAYDCSVFDPDYVAGVAGWNGIPVPTPTPPAPPKPRSQEDDMEPFPSLATPAGHEFTATRGGEGNLWVVHVNPDGKIEPGDSDDWINLGGNGSSAPTLTYNPWRWTVTLRVRGAEGQLWRRTWPVKSVRKATPWVSDGGHLVAVPPMPAT